MGAARERRFDQYAGGFDQYARSGRQGWGGAGRTSSRRSATAASSSYRSRRSCRSCVARAARQRRARTPCVGVYLLASSCLRASSCAVLRGFMRPGAKRGVRLLLELCHVLGLEELDLRAGRRERLLERLRLALRDREGQPHARRLPAVITQRVARIIGEEEPPLPPRRATARHSAPRCVTVLYTRTRTRVHTHTHKHTRAHAHACTRTDTLRRSVLTAPHPRCPGAHARGAAAQAAAAPGAPRAR